MAERRPGPVLEPDAQRFADATAGPPYLRDLGPEAARKVLEDLQSGPVDKPPVEEQWVAVPMGAGEVPVRIVRPPGRGGALPVVLYLHGGGWMLGNARTHDRLVRELAVGAEAAVVFVDYTPSPEARYPVAIEQGYEVARWLLREGPARNLDAARLAVAGDGAGGNLAAALTLLAKDRREVSFIHQSLYHPVTDAGMDTPSYAEFADGPFLRADVMAWFWNAYTTDRRSRAFVTASPLRATVEQLAGLPPAFVLVDEADVLRDEGERYAAHLREAGVPVTAVRYGGVHSDFMVLDALRGTRAARAATAQAVAVLRGAFATAPPPQEAA